MTSLIYNRSPTVEARNGAPITGRNGAATVRERSMAGGNLHVFGGVDANKTSIASSAIIWNSKRKSRTAAPSAIWR
jgi:hypothetical protein